MGRPSKAQSLGLWANGVRVGRWIIPARGDMELRYSDDWVRSGEGRPLSLSLPFNPHNEPIKTPAVGRYFDNLLPDSESIRKRVAARFKTGSTEAFDLLKAIGRDCVGAIQLLDEDSQPTSPDTIDAVRVDDEAIERHLQGIVAAPDRFNTTEDEYDDFRISLAGAQEKDAFLWWKDAWHKPRGSTPTTHIFKLPLGLVGGMQADFTTSVDNEWLCLKLLRAYGFPVTNADIATFGTQRVLVVERFDRRWSDDRLLRLPQEDFCQATGTSPLLKYEADGGPGLSKLVGLLRGSTNANEDMRTLMATQIMFWLLHAPDGHAKNYSIRLLAGGSFHMTPLYDVMSAYPAMDHGKNRWDPRRIRMAMALQGKNKHYNMATIQRRHFSSTARELGLDVEAEEIIQDIIERTPAVLANVSNELPPGFSAQVADTVLAGLKNAVARLAAMPAQ